MLKFCCMGVHLRSRDLLKFWEISANISETLNGCSSSSCCCSGSGFLLAGCSYKVLKWLAADVQWICLFVCSQPSWGTHCRRWWWKSCRRSWTARSSTISAVFRRWTWSQTSRWQAVTVLRTWWAHGATTDLARFLRTGNQWMPARYPGF